MKLPFSLTFIKTTFQRALANVNRKLQLNMPLVFKTPLSQRLHISIPPKKANGRKPTKAKGSPRSEATKYNHPRKDVHGTHG